MAFTTPEDRKILNAMRRRMPGGCEWKKGTKFKAAQEADVAHQTRKRLYAEAKEHQRRAEMLEAEAKMYAKKFEDSFGY